MSDDEYVIELIYKSEREAYKVILDFIGYVFKNELGLITYELLEKETGNKESKYFLDKDYLLEIDYKKQIDKIIYVEYKTDFMTVSINADGGTTSILSKVIKIGELPLITSVPVNFTFDNRYLSNENIVTEMTTFDNNLAI